MLIWFSAQLRQAKKEQARLEARYRDLRVKLLWTKLYRCARRLQLEQETERVLRRLIKRIA